jgi:hypothetical protein
VAEYTSGRASSLLLFFLSFSFFFLNANPDSRDVRDDGPKISSRPFDDAAMNQSQLAAAAVHVGD